MDLARPQHDAASGSEIGEAGSVDDVDPIPVACPIATCGHVLHVPATVTLTATVSMYRLDPAALTAAIRAHLLDHPEFTGV